MHELGVVFYVMKDVEKVAAENHASSVESVTLQLGEVSSVIPSYLTDCWRWAIKKSEVLKDTELLIEPIKAVSFCEDCMKEYNTVKYGRTCPHCGSENTYLLKGNEFIIKEIAIPEDAPEQEAE